MVNYRLLLLVLMKINPWLTYIQPIYTYGQPVFAYIHSY
jgi:hypothetical protein